MENSFYHTPGRYAEPCMKELAVAKNSKQIVDLLTELNSALTELSGVHGVLADRLGPILNKPYPSENNTNEFSDKVDFVPLGSVLYGEILKVRELSKSTKSLIQQLEI